jgi:hypothetical protein
VVTFSLLKSFIADIFELLLVLVRGFCGALLVLPWCGGSAVHSLRTLSPHLHVVDMGYPETHHHDVDSI